MKLSRTSIVVALATGMVACSSSSRTPAPFFSDDTGADTNAPAEGGLDGTTPPDSAVGDGSQDGQEAGPDTSTPHDGGDATSGDAHDADGTVLVDAADATDGVSGDMGKPWIATMCDPTMTFAAVTALPSLSSPADEIAGTITPDELTLVWTYVDGAGASRVAFADRASATDSFGPVQVLPATLQVGSSHVTIDPDGLRIVSVNPLRTSLQQVSRTARGVTFGAADAAPFGAISPGDGFFVDDPVYGADGKSLYYAVFIKTGRASVQRATRASSTATWATATPLAGAPFTATGTAVPTGVATDGRTIFLWDPVAKRASMTFSDATGAFGAPIDLGARANASPIQDCTRLYFSNATAGAGLDLAYAE